MKWTSCYVEWWPWNGNLATDLTPGETENCRLRGSLKTAVAESDVHMGTSNRTQPEKISPARGSLLAGATGRERAEICFVRKYTYDASQIQ